MHGHGKSDKPIVPKKQSNNGGETPPPAEIVEGRGLAKGNPQKQNSDRAQNRESLQNALWRIRQKAKEDKEIQFTTLWHHVYSIDHLREVFFSMKKNAAAGIDGVTWRQYAKNLEENLQELHERLKRGAYRAKMVRRQHIPKADGRMRPLGIPVLEDKIVQKAAADVLNAVYEADFMGFSYGFRPGRSPHNALDAVSVGIERKKISWILDADIRGFYDNVDHDWLIKFVEHRIIDKRVIRHIRKWLNAGVMEDGKRVPTVTGTPQGSSISPILANVYLHYAFDLWAHQWRKTMARRDVMLVRVADDIVAGFEHKSDAEKFLDDLKERFAKFCLELHPDKTRLIEFGRFAASNCKRKGTGRPGTFEFLGFTHICGKTRNDRFAIVRRTSKKKMRNKLKEVKKNLQKRLHHPIPEVGKWLASVVRGHNNYFGVPRNIESVRLFRQEIVELWYKALKRRSQKSRLNWERMKRLVRAFIPYVKIVHPYPDRRLCVNTRGRSPVR